MKRSGWVVLILLVAALAACSLLVDSIEQFPSRLKELVQSTSQPLATVSGDGSLSTLTPQLTASGQATARSAEVSRTRTPTLVVAAADVDFPLVMSGPESTSISVTLPISEELGAALQTTPQAVSTATPTATATCDLVRCSGLVHREGNQLILNGEPFVFVGFNIVSLMDTALPESEIPAIFDTLADWGVTMIRIWVIPGKDLDRFERILDMATSRGLRFIVTLQDYYFYKDMRWFSTFYKTEDLPHIEEVVTRFRDRPEIAIWEVMNEPWCGAEGEVTDPKCYAVLQAWAEDTTALIRKLDPCRPISLGLMGARNLDIELEAFRNLNAIDTVDIISMHRVPADWYNDPKELNVAKELNKPIMLGEVTVIGYTSNCQQIGPFVVPERARKVAADMQKALDLGLSGYLIWDYAPEPVTDENGTVRYFCGIYSYNKNDPIGSRIRALSIPRVAINP